MGGEKRFNRLRRLSEACRITSLLWSAFHDPSPHPTLLAKSARESGPRRVFLSHAILDKQSTILAHVQPYQLHDLSHNILTTPRQQTRSHHNNSTTQQRPAHLPQISHTANMSREAYTPPTLTGGSNPAIGQANTGFEAASSGFEDTSRPVHYLCGDCDTKVTLKRGDPIRCKECGYRVLYKERTNR